MPYVLLLRLYVLLVQQAPAVVVTPCAAVGCQLRTRVLLLVPLLSSGRRGRRWVVHLLLLWGRRRWVLKLLGLLVMLWVNVRWHPLVT
jgi:hypothetical protein